ncbi:DNA repair protein REV1 isoform X2 [Ricinus communis]|uniref:DNA repair protein REV1 isoform X2 n=1 Tax=Ricinus communis TaxID=3988 RepID=UPI00201A932E|nr:DNA repair protein REV1 isoform X2 [Ricinus communis]XP_048231553.1 DNA repair protein REV1 isoform X2 [Ricinus communis]XP_048231555.1 DNA repair protein REV1 isoform X2 [Ricinus communis]XP_048231556.1 DNA repair protein REV1 isoform X2 [Ricinus communis]
MKRLVLPLHFKTTEPQSSFFCTLSSLSFSLTKMSHDSSRSANSGQKSKRSLNNLNSTNTSNKKSKSSKQKTLGMAWGSNSVSSSRSSFRSSPFSDFSSYMVVKNRKLQNQFNAAASNSSNGDGLIFNGVSIFVDGFTSPSSQELRGYMLKYGGRFENYFSRHRVTHIICSNLPDSKIKNLRSFSGGLPVVRPAWILDSVAANKLLSWVPYQLEQLANNQPKLSAFFCMKNKAASEDDLNIEAFQVMLDPSLKGGTSQDTNLPEVNDPVKYGKPIDGQFDYPDCEIEETSSRSSKSSELRIEEPSNTEGENNVYHELQSSPRDHSIESTPTPAIARPSNPRHSTLEDPNFVENYFKSSRLHFIGTWRNRYRKRFPRLSSDFRCRSLTIDASDNSHKTVIMHVDMDCFFVSVVIRNHPELHDKPVAVCHSDNPKGTAEISSANYPARAYGIKAGIFVRDAKALCPQLIIFPYNFQAYEEVADQFYNVLHKHCNKVQAVSCDEAFLDITDFSGGDPEVLASTIRKEIFETTGCTASAGIARNMLLSRLATRTAKPDGQCYIRPEKVDEYLNELSIKTLPGIGHVLEEKLKKKNVRTCGQLRLISKDSLHKDFGKKTGEMLWNYSRGIDNRLVGVIQESKSIGAEVNWGVRFRNLQDSQHFLLNLCKEVSLRLQGCGVHGRTFTLKIKKRRKDAGEPTKYMGCGDCENLSHSMTVPVATDDVDVLQRIAKQLFGSFNLDVKEIRGVGLQVSKLENADISRGLERNSLRSWLTSASTMTEERHSINSISTRRADSDPGLQSTSAPPRLFDLDMGVIESLPPELVSELNDIYGGKLVDFIAQNKGKSENGRGSSSIPSHGQEEGAKGYDEGPLASNFIPPKTILVENKEQQHTAEEILLAAPSSGFSSNDGSTHTLGLGNTDLMPSSLSQVDTSVLQQLPDELKADILGLLPAHRRLELTSNSSMVPLTKNPQELLGITENQTMPVASVLNNDLWIGNPPRWVDKFKVSNCLILNSLAEMYDKLGSADNLSSVLQSTISESINHPIENDDSWDDEAAYCFCELLKQYINLKIEFDIEEIYVCFRLLRRFVSMNNLIKASLLPQVYKNFKILLASVQYCHSIPSVICWRTLWRKLAYLVLLLMIALHIDISCQVPLTIHGKSYHQVITLAVSVGLCNDCQSKDWNELLDPRHVSEWR